jgi:NTP pyrophosphatase (non-canonical NTP hydrolase)
MSKRADELYTAIREELDHAYSKHGKKPWSRHEFYAILLEEVDELWETIKKDMPQEELLKELTQVAAMCFRYVELGDRYKGEHPPIPLRTSKKKECVCNKAHTGKCQSPKIRKPSIPPK